MIAGVLRVASGVLMMKATNYLTGLALQEQPAALRLFLCTNPRH